VGCIKGALYKEATYLMRAPGSEYGCRGDL
jgi:hypothetical protein